MRNWEAIVERQLNGLALEPGESAEVIAELAAHLAETCEEFRKQGMTEDEAARRTLSQVEDWQKENVMTNRVKQFWLPSLLTLFLSMGLLMLIQSLGPNPWIAARRSGWSLIAPVAVIYLPWLFLLPLIGALGAYLSNRAGGSQRAMLTSIVFPVLPYFVFFLLALPVTVLFNESLGHNIMFIALFLGLLVWVVAPGAALLAGGVLARTFLSRRSDARGIAGG